MAAGLMLSGCSELDDEVVDFGQPGETAEVERASTPGETWEPDDYPLELTPPHIRAPAYECAQRVRVESLLEDAVVRVYDEDDNTIGAGTANHAGRARITLDYPLEAGERKYGRTSV